VLTERYAPGRNTVLRITITFWEMASLLLELASLVCAEAIWKVTLLSIKPQDIESCVRIKRLVSMECLEEEI